MNNIKFEGLGIDLNVNPVLVDFNGIKIYWYAFIIIFVIIMIVAFFIVKEIIPIINENGITEMQLDWSKLYGELSSGTYRIVKYSGLSTIFSEPFEIE